MTRTIVVTVQPPAREGAGRPRFRRHERARVANFGVVSFRRPTGVTPRPPAPSCRTMSNRAAAESAASPSGLSDAGPFDAGDAAASPSVTPDEPLAAEAFPSDLVFAVAEPEPQAVPRPASTSSDTIVERIDETLDLLAEATSAAAAVRAAGVYDVSVVVPVFNERETIPEVLDRIEEVMPPSTEVIVVDDGSTDGTGHYLRGLPPSESRRVICRRRNYGKGAAIRLGVRHSRGRVVAIQDADLEYDPADLLAAIWPILEGQADVVYGSRYRRPGQDPSRVHRLGNWLLTKLSNASTGLRLTDMETCHKAFRGDLLRSIRLQEPRFGFEPEITAKIAALGVTVMEVPVTYQPRGYAEGKKIGWSDAINTVACMWKYRRG